MKRFAVKFCMEGWVLIENLKMGWFAVLYALVLWYKTELIWETQLFPRWSILYNVYFVVRIEFYHRRPTGILCIPIVSSGFPLYRLDPHRILWIPIVSSGSPSYPLDPPYPLDPRRILDRRNPLFPPWGKQ
jgi:hypothetical protein